MNNECYKIDLAWLRGEAKQVINEAIQKTAFEKGYRWSCQKKKVHLLIGADYLCLGEYHPNGITFGTDISDFNEVKAKEISVNRALSGKYNNAEED